MTREIKKMLRTAIKTPTEQVLRDGSTAVWQYEFDFVDFDVDDSIIKLFDGCWFTMYLFDVFCIINQQKKKYFKNLKKSQTKKKDSCPFSYKNLSPKCTDIEFAMILIYFIPLLFIFPFLHLFILFLLFVFVPVWPHHYH